MCRVDSDGGVALIGEFVENYGKGDLYWFSFEGKIYGY